MSATRFPLVFGLLAAWTGPVQAHDIYMGVLSKVGLPCCNNTDCRPTPYRLTLGGVQMSVGGRWLDIPDDKVQYRALAGDSGETGGGHWCGSSGADGYFTRCAILPPQSASTMLVAPR